ncbi:hypothetical protein [Niastella populi]|uniref:Uncharacterized protein n=1 Tax=Niastella populi TaxID=550983 RepID=A0A1V9F7T7_9BACT|nr:hypothetical protein [Niastella populi]OQP54375.1 hypothetical protein A4R26_27825 [Niastella populi]
MPIPTLKIKVDYYNNEEKENIEKNFPNDFELIEAVEGKTIEIPYEDFKVYSVFRYQYDNDFSAEPSTRRLLLNCVINKRYQDFINTLLASDRNTRLREESNYLLFQMSMNVMTTSSGMCGRNI